MSVLTDKRVRIVLTNIDPIVVHDSNATSGHRGCLDFIPGSTLLGAFAGHHYQALERKDMAWQVFHSGAVRFTNAYAAIGSEQTFPIPASFHFIKGEAQDNARNWRNLASAYQREPGLQYKQMRGQFVDKRGQVAKVRKGVTVRTAINAESGTAAEGQLFQYEYLERGQTFVAEICIADTLSSEQQKILLDCITGLEGETIRVGKSRNSEFGRVQIVSVSEPTDTAVENHGNELTIWCTSDVEVLNEIGEPTLSPSLYELGLDHEGQLIPEQSFVRAQYLSRFNQARGGLDSEQVLIQKGSVLVYRLQTPLSDAQLQRLNSGVGINQAAGFGCVQVNPKWREVSREHGKVSEGSLFQAESILEADKMTGGQPRQESLQASSMLINWLQQQSAQTSALSQAHRSARHLEAAIIDFYWQARRYNRIAQAHQAGPSSTQWRRIQNVFKTHPDNWEKHCFEGEHAICKSNNDPLGWGIRWQTSPSNEESFAKRVQTLLQDQSITVLELLLERLGRFDLSSYNQLSKARKEEECQE